MAVALRLNRQGTKDRPYYKIVAVDQRKRRDGRYIEQLGTYNPLQDGENFILDLAKAEHWLAVGARPSETVQSLIRKARTKAGYQGRPAAALPEPATQAPAAVAVAAPAAAAVALAAPAAAPVVVEEPPASTEEEPPQG
jgi:small subunit ribosomal protein S16